MRRHSVLSGLASLLVGLMASVAPGWGADYGGPLIDTHSHLPNSTAIDAYVAAMKRHTRGPTSQTSTATRANATTEAQIATAVAGSGSRSRARRRFQSACRNAEPSARASAAPDISMRR